MSSFNRRAFLALPLIVAGCGFTPAFGPDGGAGDLVGTVNVAAPASRNAFEFVKQAELRLGRATVARYDLAYLIKIETVSLGVTPDGDITRYNLLGIIDWTLTAHSGGKPVAKGRVQNFTGWSATGSTVAGLTAEADANSRLMRILADQMVTQLIAGSAAGKLK